MGFDRFPRSLPPQVGTNTKAEADSWKDPSRGQTVRGLCRQNVYRSDVQPSTQFSPRLNGPGSDLPTALGATPSLRSRRALELITLEEYRSGALSQRQDPEDRRSPTLLSGSKAISTIPRRRESWFFEEDQEQQEV